MTYYWLHWAPWRVIRLFYSLRVQSPKGLVIATVRRPWFARLGRLTRFR